MDAKAPAIRVPEKRSWVWGIALPLLLAVSAGCASGGARLTRTDGEPVASIYVVSHGWHTGVALERRHAAGRAWPEVERFATTYVEAGWGDRDFYMAPGFNAWYALKAIAWPTASVVHVAGFDEHPARRFPSSEVVELRVTRAGLDALVDYIAASFSRPAGEQAAEPLARGLYGTASAFYPSALKFHLFRTCNVWTAGALRAAGATRHDACCHTNHGAPQEREAEGS